MTNKYHARPTVLTLPLPPSLNNLYATVRGRRVLSLEGRRYRLAAQNEASAAFSAPLVGNLVLTLHVYMSRLSDLDNRIKACQDSMKGIAYASDMQVCEIHAYRHIDRENPRVELTLEVTA